jgi:ssDNA-binding Zn-finger/Zn-ribbon topoisomerase 1
LKAAEKAEEKAIETCPLCGSAMEKGYIASRMIAWSNKKISNWSFKGLWGGEIVVSRGYPWPIANVEATRCRKCKLIIFRYGKAGNSAKEGSP